MWRSGDKSQSQFSPSAQSEGLIWGSHLAGPQVYSVYALVCSDALPFIFQVPILLSFLTLPMEPQDCMHCFTNELYSTPDSLLRVLILLPPPPWYWD